MNRKISLGCVAIAFAIFLLNVIFSGQIVHAQTDAAGAGLYNDIGAYLQRSVKNARIPAMSVAIVDQDDVLFSQSYGDCENCDTPFVLGSVSKSFTAVCIMRLVQQGKIDLNANIAAYLPDAVEGDRITVNQLLNHTSGLGEHQTLQNYKIVNAQGIHTYANVNYSLLGKIIETVSGQTYSDFITENLFQPLALSHTATTRGESEKNGLIEGYTNYWGFHVRRDHQYPLSENAWITVPAGYISASANDLGKYLQMYLNGGNGILSEQSIETMFYGNAVYVDNDDAPYWYGYGWTMVKELFSEPVLRHSGLVETGTSCVYILPESELAVAVTANVNDYFVANTLLDRIGWGVVSMLLGESPNEIAGRTYILRHIGIDLLLLALFAAAVLTLCPLSKYANRIKKQKRLPTVWRLVALHFFLPLFVVLLVPVFFRTPLWVAKAFVPDVFITVKISSTLFFAGGMVKCRWLLRNALAVRREAKNQKF